MSLFSIAVVPCHLKKHTDRNRLEIIGSHCWRLFPAVCIVVSCSVINCVSVVLLVCLALSLNARTTTTARTPTWRCCRPSSVDRLVPKRPALIPVCRPNYVARVVHVTRNEAPRPPPLTMMRSSSSNAVKCPDGRPCPIRLLWSGRTMTTTRTTMATIVTIWTIRRRVPWVKSVPSNNGLNCVAQLYDHQLSVRLSSIFYSRTICISSSCSTRFSTSLVYV